MVTLRILSWPSLDPELINPSPSAFLASPILVADITDSSGNRLQHYVYSTYGQLLEVQNGTGVDITSNPVVRTTYTFAGRELDPESGLYYMRARYYDANTGRFLQTDPAPGQLKLPVSVTNHYIYAGNNPSNMEDTSGASFLSIIGDVLIAAVAIAVAAVAIYAIAAVAIAAGSAAGGAAAAFGITGTAGAVLGTIGGAGIGALAGSQIGKASGALIGGFVEGGFEALNGGSFSQGFTSGAVVGASIGQTVGAVVGGIAGGYGGYTGFAAGKATELTLGGIVESGLVSAGSAVLIAPIPTEAGVPYKTGSIGEALYSAGGSLFGSIIESGPSDDVGKPGVYVHQ